MHNFPANSKISLQIPTFLGKELPKFPTFSHCVYSIDTTLPFCYLLHLENKFRDACASEPASRWPNTSILKGAMAATRQGAGGIFPNSEALSKVPPPPSSKGKKWKKRSNFCHLKKTFDPQKLIPPPLDAPTIFFWCHHNRVDGGRGGTWKWLWVSGKQFTLIIILICRFL